MKEYNYFLHTDLWSKQVILAMIFLKYNKNVLSNTKKFQITNKHCQTMPNFSNKRPFPLQGRVLIQLQMFYLGVYRMWAIKRCQTLIRIFTVSILLNKFPAKALKG